MLNFFRRSKTKDTIEYNKNRNHESQQTNFGEISNNITKPQKNDSTTAPLYAVKRSKTMEISTPYANIRDSNVSSTSATSLTTTSTCDLRPPPRHNSTKTKQPYVANICDLVYLNRNVQQNKSIGDTFKEIVMAPALGWRNKKQKNKKKPTIETNPRVVQTVLSNGNEQEIIQRLDGGERRKQFSANIENVKTNEDIQSKNKFESETLEVFLPLELTRTTKNNNNTLEILSNHVETPVGINNVTANQSVCKMGGNQVSKNNISPSNNNATVKPTNEKQNQPSTSANSEVNTVLTTTKQSENTQTNKNNETSTTNFPASDSNLNPKTIETPQKETNKPSEVTKNNVAAANNKIPKVTQETNKNNGSGKGKKEVMSVPNQKDTTLVKDDQNVTQSRVQQTVPSISSNNDPSKNINSELKNVQTKPTLPIASIVGASVQTLETKKDSSDASNKENNDEKIRITEGPSHSKNGVVVKNQQTIKDTKEPAVSITQNAQEQQKQTINKQDAKTQKLNVNANAGISADKIESKSDNKLPLKSVKISSEVKSKQPVEVQPVQPQGGAKPEKITITENKNSNESTEKHQELIKETLICSSKQESQQAKGVELTTKSSVELTNNHNNQNSIVLPNQQQSNAKETISSTKQKVIQNFNKNNQQNKVTTDSPKPTQNSSEVSKKTENSNTANTKVQELSNDGSGTRNEVAVVPNTQASVHTDKQPKGLAGAPKGSPISLNKTACIPNTQQIKPVSNVSSNVTEVGSELTVSLNKQTSVENNQDANEMTVIPKETISSNKPTCIQNNQPAKEVTKVSSDKQTSDQNNQKTKEVAVVPKAKIFSNKAPCVENNQQSKEVTKVSCDKPTSVQSTQETIEVTVVPKETISSNKPPCIQNNQQTKEVTKVSSDVTEADIQPDVKSIKKGSVQKKQIKEVAEESKESMVSSNKAANIPNNQQTKDVTKVPTDTEFKNATNACSANNKSAQDLTKNVNQTKVNNLKKRNSADALIVSNLVVNENNPKENETLKQVTPQKIAPIESLKQEVTKTESVEKKLLNEQNLTSGNEKAKKVAKAQDFPKLEKQNSLESKVLPNDNTNKTQQNVKKPSKQQNVKPSDVKINLKPGDHNLKLEKPDAGPLVNKPDNKVYESNTQLEPKNASNCLNLKPTQKSSTVEKVTTFGDENKKQNLNSTQSKNSDVGTKNKQQTITNETNEIQKVQQLDDAPVKSQPNKTPIEVTNKNDKLEASKETVVSLAQMEKSKVDRGRKSSSEMDTSDDETPTIIIISDSNPINKKPNLKQSDSKPTQSLRVSFADDTIIEKECDEHNNKSDSDNAFNNQSNQEVPIKSSASSDFKKVTEPQKPFMVCSISIPLPAKIINSDKIPVTSVIERTSNLSPKLKRKEDGQANKGDVQKYVYIFFVNFFHCCILYAFRRLRVRIGW